MTTRAGRWLQQVVVAVALWVVGTSALGIPLSYLGLWRPVVVLPLVALGAWQAWLLAARVPAADLSRGVTGCLVGLTLAATAWFGLTHHDQALPRRDAGSNLQAALILATEHERVVAIDPKPIGGAVPDGFSLASPAFYQVGSASEPAIQPQFVIGPAAIYSLGVWAAGPVGGQLVPALMMGLALLGFGLLVGRIVGRRWGPPALLAAAVCFPLVHAGRSTLSEPLADLVLMGAALALVAAAEPGRVAASAGLAGRAVLSSGAVAGALVGGATLVRIDALREMVLLTVVGVLALLQQREWAAPMLRWGWGATVYGFLAAVVLSYRYLGDIAGSLIPLVAGALLIGLAGLVVVRLARRGRTMPSGISRRLGPALAGLTVLAGVVLASRPLWQVVRQNPKDSGARYVATLQAREGLPIDGGRTYAEHTVAWLGWWVGPIALVVALGGLAVVMGRIGRAWSDGQSLPAYAGPLLVAAGSTLATLYRPGITPDHPWADRRLHLALLLVIGLVVAAAASLARRIAGRRGVALGALVVAALVVPSALATWPLRAGRVEAGSSAAVTAVCAALHPRDVVVMADDRAVNEWPEVVRGQCGRLAISPTGATRRDGSLASRLPGLAATVTAAGGRLVLLAADSDQTLPALGVTDVVHASSVQIMEDQRILTRRPDRLVPLSADVWLGRLP